MAQVTALSPLGTPGLPYAFAAKAAAALYTAFGAMFLYTASHWTGKSLYFEATMKVEGAGMVRARLRDVTDNDVVAGSNLNTADAAADRVRSAALTLEDGHEYRAELGSDSGASGTGFAATLIAI